MKELTTSEQNIVLGGLSYTSYLGLTVSATLIATTTFLAYNFGDRTGFDKEALEVFKRYSKKPTENQSE